MYELCRLSERCYYVESPARVGIYKINEREVALIDAGNNREAGKRLKKIIEKEGWSLRMILITHSHADHIGGARYLKDQTGCSVYAKGAERDFTEHTVFEPALLYGACPPPALRHKFLLAEECPALSLTEEVLPDGLSIIDLGGHTVDMVGFLSEDGVCYLADALSGRETLEKYGVGYIYDVDRYLNVLRSICGLNAKIFLPSHVPPLEDIRPLAEYNISRTLEVRNFIRSLCNGERVFEDILALIFDKYSLNMTFEQHALVGSTVRSYLSSLLSAGEINAVFESNRLMFIDVK